jgi:hypothetical protein
MKTIDYSTLSTAALLKIRGRSKPGSEGDQAIERELAGRGESAAPRLGKRERRQIPLLFTATEWEQTRHGTSPSDWRTREREGP